MSRKGQGRWRLNLLSASQVALVALLGIDAGVAPAMADPQTSPQHSAEMRIRPSLVPTLWDAHGRFMQEKQNPDCFSVIVEPKNEGVEIHYIGLTRHVETDPGYFELRLICATARSITFYYDQSGRFLRLQWNR